MSYKNLINNNQGIILGNEDTAFLLSTLLFLQRKVFQALIGKDRKKFCTFVG